MIISSGEAWVAAIPKPGIFLDIGVKRVDGYDVLEAKLVHDRWLNVPIIGFEPHPQRFSECVGKYPGALLNLAIGERDREEVFYEVDSMAVRHPRKGQDHSKPLKVRIRSLESLEAEMGPWNRIFIWSDTEGCEHEVLLGARRLFDEGKVVGLNLELWDSQQAEGWAMGPEVVEFLRARGFSARHEWARSRKDPHRDVVFLKDSL